MKKIYLAVPYSGMQESSYKQANEASVLILNKGHNVFSPITHSHPLTSIGNLSVPHTWEYWRNIDLQFVDWADEVWVLVPKEGIEAVMNSTGVTEETIYAQDRDKPVRYFEVNTKFDVMQWDGNSIHSMSRVIEFKQLDEYFYEKEPTL
jgi:nucleoside 2-deoxyribosyltransferase